MWSVVRRCRRLNLLSKRCTSSSSSSSPPEIINAKLLSSIPDIGDAFTLFVESEEHRARQSKLVENVVNNFLVSHQNKKSLLVVPSTKKGYQADTQIPQLTLKQNADFVYLTGLNCTEAANSVLVLVADEEAKFKSLLFIPFLTDSEVTWEGMGLKSPEFAQRLEVICDSLENVKYVESFISEESGTRHVFTTRGGISFENKNGPRKLFPCENNNETNSIVKKPVLDLSKVIDQQRVIKSASEVKCMKRTCSIGSEALSSARDYSRLISRDDTHNMNVSLVNESHVAAKFDFESRIKGANKLSYPSVVAGGSRATFIHYGSCNKFMREDDWILMDAGCEDREGYCSDITRCWMMSANGTSSQARLQSALYEALCEVQQHLTNHVKSHLPLSSSAHSPLSSLTDTEDTSSSSSVSLDQLFQIMCVLLGKVLIEFCVIPKSSSSSESVKAAYKHCPHHVSHFLGLDVHDTPSISRSLPLKPGMCFTLEPGLYFRQSDADVKREFKGIGLRVEDDLIIHPDTGLLQVLTKECSW